MPARLRPLALVPLLLAGLAPSALGSEDHAFFHENVMGTSLELKVRADSLASARSAERRVLAEIDRLSALLSGYDPESEFRRWLDQPGAGAAAVSDELFEVLSASDRWRSLSRGAFDPRVQAWSELWSRCSKQDRLPTEAERRETRERLGQAAWRLDPQKGTAERLDGPPVSLNAIAKGYIVERACAVAMASGPGIEGVILNVGGDLRACGSLSAQVGLVPPWSDSETSAPIRIVSVRDRALATSGRSQRGFQIGDRWYSHILDPRTGEPVSEVASASVLAARSADADALATIFNVLPPVESLRLAESLEDVECLIVTRDNGILTSDGWARFAVEPGDPALMVRADEPQGEESRTAAKPAAPLWSDEYELVVNFTINQPDASRRYRRPYVALWISDSTGRPVRYLILWVSLGGSGPDRWLPDLRRWYRSDKARNAILMKNMAYTLGRPTKPPGKYAIIWDGKDDHGRPVPAGQYVVNLEAVREHGTYGMIQQEVTIGGEPFSKELKGNVEIQSASIVYRPKAQKPGGAR